MKELAVLRLALMLLARFSAGKVSLKHAMKKIKSAKESKRANSAGNTNQSPTFVFAQTAKIAPIRGPMMKPNEKAIPTKAIPLPLVFIDDTSAMIAMLSDTFPLLIPPMNRAKINKTKLFDSAQRT
jgi:hypothetical protein